MHSCTVLSVSVAVIAILLIPLFNTNYLWNLRRPLLSSSPSVVADLLVTNGVIYTSDASLPFADSMAIRGGRILRVGNYSSVQDLIGHGTEILNVEGRGVVPGFIDSHVHLIWGGLQMMRVELRTVSSKDEFVRKVKDAVRNLEPGSWVLGGGWNNDLWGGELPMASWIDDITAHNPVWLSRKDGHMGLANSLALKTAGISNETKDPNGGTIMRTSTGAPTGLLIDSASKLVFSCIPEVSVDERREALLKANNHALSRGVTTVVDFGRYLPGSSVELPWEDFSEVYGWADFSGKLKIRVCLFFPMKTWSRLQDLINKKGRKMSQWLYLGGVKDFSDGSLGSNSALFYEPYADDPQNFGLQVTEIECLFNMTVASDTSGLQVAIHAIGDRANGLILDMYRSVVSTNGMRERRFRIEHAQHLVSEMAAQFGGGGIVASVQPDHLLDDADTAIRKLGRERAKKESYLFQSLLTGKALLAFGSDWPVADINPLNSIKTAMKRIPPGWKHSWMPSERVNLYDALNAYTISAARACFLDEEVGSLSPGKFADFVVLSTDSWDTFVEEGSASVWATYVGGMRAYP